MFISICIVLAILRGVFIHLATHSHEFRYHSKLRDSDVKPFCWFTLIPLIGEIIMIASMIICLITYLDDLFEVKK